MSGTGSENANRDDDSSKKIELEGDVAGHSKADYTTTGTVTADLRLEPLPQSGFEMKVNSSSNLEVREEEFVKQKDIKNIPLVDSSSGIDGAQPLDRSTVDGSEQQKIDYWQYLKKASTNGTVKTKNTNLGIGGASGVGKTSTLKLLTDQEPDPQHDSTDVLKPIEYFSEDNDKSSDEEEEDSSTESSSDDEDANKSDDKNTATDTSPGTAVVKSKPWPAKGKPRPVKQYLIVATKKNKWNPATQQALLHRLASCVVTLATENESSKSSTHKPRKKKGPLTVERKFFHRKPSFSKDGPGPKSVPDPTSDVAKNLQKMSFDDLEAAQKIIDVIESNEDLKELGVTHFVNASDMGGQAAFIDIAPALMRFNSLNLVLFRLDEKLDGLAKFFYSVKGEIVGCEKHQITTKSMIYSMIASKSKIQKPDIKGMEVLQTQNKSMFMIIGTHLDEYEKLPKDSRESLEKKEKVLNELLHEFKDCIIPNGENIIFSLNTLSRDKKTRKMAATIRELAMQYYIEAKVPISWYIFQLAINEIKVKKKGIIPVSKFMEVGKHIDIFEEEVRASLQYFRESSVCQYYPDVLPDVVFATPQFLFEKISELVSATLDKMCLMGVNLKDLKQFKQCGLFTMSFLKHVCKGFEDDLFTAEDFLKLMAHLFIVSQLPNDADDTPDNVKYFMPSVLQIAEKPFEGLPKSEIDVEPLLFTWNNTVPNGLFPSLVTSMLSSKDCFSMSSEVVQYRNKITFCFPKYASIVTLIEGHSFIAIAAACSVQNNSCVKEVREAVLDAIDSVVKRFDWQPSVAYPKEMFPCTAVGCVASSDHNIPFTHFSYPEINREFIVCSENSSQRIKLTNAHSIWYRSFKCTLPNILNFLEDKSADWDKIGRAFGVSLNDRQSLLRQAALTDRQRLEAVLNQWIKSSPNALTWSDFINVLTSDSLKYNSIARKVSESVGIVDLS